MEALGPHWIKAPNPEGLLAGIESIGVPWLGAAGGLLAVLAILALALRAYRRRLPCRWQRDRVATGTALVKFQCRTCGVEAFCSTGRPPQGCKHHLLTRPH